MAWFLTAASRKEQALNTFNVQMKFVTSLGSLMYANEVGVCVQACVGRVGEGGWVAAGKTFLIYPLVPDKVFVTLEQGGTSKMTPLTKFAPPHPLSWHSEFAKERFEFKNALLREGKKNPLHKSEKKEKGRGRLEVATDLREVVRTMGWIGSCWCNVPQQKQHTGKRLSLQNLSSTPLHFYVCINTENNYRNDLFFILPSSHVAGEHISETCTVHRAHCIIMYLYKEPYSSTFCSSLQGELNHTVSCWSAILEWGSLRGPCKCKAGNICVKSGQKGCFCMWGIRLQRQVLADKLGQYQCEETESGGLLSYTKNNAHVNRCAHDNAEQSHTNQRKTYKRRAVFLLIPCMHIMHTHLTLGEGTVRGRTINIWSPHRE